MEVEIFGHKLNLKEEYCTLCNEAPKKIKEPYINMYVTVTNGCNSNCAFCCNEKNACKKVDFDYYKFYYIVSEISKKLAINKCSFTGGEPTLEHELLTKLITTVKDIDADIFTVINTNGMNIKKLEEFVGDIDSIAFSHHHYDEEVNKQIFGTPTVASNEDIKTFINPNKLHASCNLIKGHICDPKSITKYLEHLAEIGITDVGFVSLMPANDYCKENFVDFKDINFANIPNLYLSKEWNNKTYCRCRNYVYLSEKGVPVKVYFRYYVDPSYAVSTLVYDGKYLREGFNGKIII